MLSAANNQTVGRSLNRQSRVRAIVLTAHSHATYRAVNADVFVPSYPISSNKDERNTDIVSNFKRACWQEEECPETGRVHIQAYVEFNGSLRYNRIRTLFPNCHVEGRKGTKEQATTYCTKNETRLRGPYYYPSEEEFKELGKGQGKRSDISAAAELILNGTPMRDVACEHPTVYVKYNRGLSALRNITGATYDSNLRTTVIVVQGATGTGKSRWAHEQAAKYGYYSVFSANWFDGYQGESIIVIDEFNPSEWQLTKLLKYLDRYVQRVPIKGGSGIRKWQCVIITSTVPYANWFETHRQPEFNRRVTGDNNQYPENVMIMPGHYDKVLNYRDNAYYVDCPPSHEQVGPAIVRVRMTPERVSSAPRSEPHRTHGATGSRDRRVVIPPSPPRSPLSWTYEQEWGREHDDPIEAAQAANPIAMVASVPCAQPPYTPPMDSSDEAGPSSAANVLVDLCSPPPTKLIEGNKRSERPVQGFFERLAKKRIFDTMAVCNDDSDDDESSDDGSDNSMQDFIVD